MAHISSSQHPGTCSDDHHTNTQIEAQIRQNEAKHCFRAGVINFKKLKLKETHLNSHSENVWSNTDNSVSSFPLSDSDSDNTLESSSSDCFTRPRNGKSVMAANTTNKQVQTTNFPFSRCRNFMFLHQNHNFKSMQLRLNRSKHL